MKVCAGVWVDHRGGIIVLLSNTGDETKQIHSGIEKQLRRSGDHPSGTFEAQKVPADDSRERAYSGQLARYYDKIISALRDAGSILILGPGEAKGELRKRFDKDNHDPRVFEMESADKMTTPQLIAYVRRHFQRFAAGRKAFALFPTSSR